MNPTTEHKQSQKLEAINAIFGKNFTICDLVLQDL